MTTIIEQSPQPIFTIKSVSEQTGILPVTIRAWERRHEVLSPHRSGNRYRLYSEKDIAVLHWIKNRVDGGISISSAATELRTLMQSGNIPEIAPITHAAPRPTGIPPAEYAKRLYTTLTSHNESLAGEVFYHANSAFDLLDLFTLILGPTLVNLGDAWYRGEIRVATEHFASSFIRGKLLAILQSFPSKQKAAFILIGCAPDEFHEIGSLMIAILLRKSGYRVEFLGADIPIEDLVDYAGDEHPRMIILSATMAESAQQLIKLPSQLNKMKRPPYFAYGGYAFINNDELQHRLDGIYLGDTLNLAIEKVAEILKPI